MCSAIEGQQQKTHSTKERQNRLRGNNSEWLLWKRWQEMLYNCCGNSMLWEYQLMLLCSTEKWAQALPPSGRSLCFIVRKAIIGYHLSFVQHGRRFGPSTWPRNQENQNTSHGEEGEKCLQSQHLHKNRRRGVWYKYPDGKSSQCLWTYFRLE